MPATRKPLTDADIRKVPIPSKDEGPTILPDGLGLYLEIRPSGKRVWRYRYRIAGKPNIYTMRDYGKAADQFTIEEARTELRRAREMVEGNLHPTLQRRKELAAVVDDQTLTFRVAAESWITKEAKRLDWSAGYVYQQRRALTELYPLIGNLPVTAITSKTCMDVLERFADKRSWASVLRMVMSRTFKHNGIGKTNPHNPTLTILRAARKPRPKPPKFLLMKDIADFIDAVRLHPNINRAEKIAIQFAMLTLVRPGEVCSAKWEHFDFEGKQFGGPSWVIPGSEMKMESPHLVPLSRQAIELLAELRKINGDTPYLLPLRSKTCRRENDSRRGDEEYISSDRLSGNIRKTEFAGRIHAHGLRRTASTFLNGFKEWRGDPVELQLAHMFRGNDSQAQVRALYNLADLIEERRPMMQFYADACMPPKKPAARKRPGNVVQIRRAAA